MPACSRKSSVRVRTGGDILRNVTRSNGIVDVHRDPRLADDKRGRYHAARAASRCG